MKFNKTEAAAVILILAGLSLGGWYAWRKINGPDSNPNLWGIQVLNAGLEEYHSWNGVVPPIGKEGTPLTEEEYVALIEVLSCEDVNKDGKISGNPQKRSFLPESDKGVLKDGFGRRYVVYLDVNNDGVTKAGSRTFHQRYVIYSKGKNGTDDGGLKDDIGVKKQSEY